jgi:hypothetical protein
MRNVRMNLILYEFFPVTPDLDDKAELFPTY